jgi:hypothetical protein
MIHGKRSGAQDRVFALYDRSSPGQNHLKRYVLLSAAYAVYPGYREGAESIVIFTPRSFSFIIISAGTPVPKPYSGKTDLNTLSTL